jgi:hypothetical protein
MLGMKLGIFATSRWAIATTGMGRLGDHLSSRKIGTIHIEKTNDDIETWTAPGPWDNGVPLGCVLSRGATCLWALAVSGV